jgi:hypothetical protein
MQCSRASTPVPRALPCRACWGEPELHSLAPLPPLLSPARSPLTLSLSSRTRKSPPLSTERARHGRRAGASHRHCPWPPRFPSPSRERQSPHRRTAYPGALPNPNPRWRLLPHRRDRGCACGRATSGYLRLNRAVLWMRGVPPRCSRCPSPRPAAAGARLPRMAAVTAACSHGREAMGHLWRRYDRLRVCLDAAVLVGRFLATVRP